MLRTTKILSYLNFAMKDGVSAENLLAGTGLSLETLSRPSELIGFDQARQILNNLAAQSCADMALRHGVNTRQIDMGIVGHAMLSCSNMREVGSMWVKFSEVIGLPLKFKSIILDETWTLEFIPVFLMSEKALQFCLEDAIACLIPLIEEVTGADFKPLYLEMTISEPANAGLYHQYISSPIKFNAKRNGFTIAKIFLDTPVRSTDREMLAICDAHCSAILKNIQSTSSVAQHVREILLTCRGAIPEIADVADRLGYSKRTLNRKLQAEGHTYQKLVEDFRKDYAFELLHENVLQVKQIGYALGFKNTNSFRRVFKSWTGQAIKEWQRTNILK